LLPDWNEAAADLNIPNTSRAEALTIRQWCELAAWAPLRAKAPASPGQDIHGEIFDIVDPEDRVLAQTSRFEVHRQGLLHRAVHIFVFNQTGALFLQKRSRWKDVCPLKWDSSAAGHVNAGQDYEETAHRELQEELGIQATLRRVSKLGPCEETGHEFVVLFEAHHDGPMNLPPSEVECGEWFTLPQINNWAGRRPDDFAPGFLKCWEAWSHSHSNPPQ
jgi:16S rRNA (adenine1518-N6/adenine1519-N6)-dimethyltransferase